MTGPRRRQETSQKGGGGAFLASHYLSLGAERDFALTAGRAAGMLPAMEEELVARLDGE